MSDATPMVSDTPAAPERRGRTCRGRARRCRTSARPLGGWNRSAVDVVGVVERAGPARGAASTTRPTSQPTASQKPQPKPFVGEPLAGRRRRGRPRPTGASGDGRGRGAVGVSGSGMAHPRVEDAVEEVDGEVDDDEDGGDDHHAGLHERCSRSAATAPASCEPIPLMLKMNSMITAPPISWPMLRPTTVSSVKLDGRSAWRKRIAPHGHALGLRHADVVLLTASTPCRCAAAG